MSLPRWGMTSEGQGQEVNAGTLAFAVAALNDFACTVVATHGAGAASQQTMAGRAEAL